MQQRSVIIEIIIWVALMFSGIPYITWILFISSIINMINPYNQNQIVQFLTFPIKMLRQVAVFIDKKLP